MFRKFIWQGLPCHLYFDLEFDKTVNADKNVDDMVDILMSVTFDILFDKYAIEANDGWIIELDSSTTSMLFGSISYIMTVIYFLGPILSYVFASIMFLLR